SVSAARAPRTTRTSPAGWSSRASRASLSTRTPWWKPGCSSRSRPLPPGANGLGPRALAEPRLRAVLVVEGLDVDVLERRLIEAAHVDAVALGVGAWHVEGLDAAASAEQVPRRAGVEGVLAERVRAAEQPEPRARHAQRVHLRSEEHTSELQSHLNLVCRLLLEKKKKTH